MARQETIFTVMVASPSDVDEERNRLEEVIRELNIAWARELGIRLELVRWETHAFPSFGEDAQAVINGQIPDDYDLFIGIMWYRFGTPTGRAGSGTIEEFRRAKERFDRDPSALQLMIYFKDAPAPIAPSKLDYDQIAKVAEFRASLGSEGGLFWPYLTTEDFEKLVRLHLTRHVQAFRSKDATHHKQVIIRSEEESLSLSKNYSDDEPGLLDLMEQFEDEFATLHEISDRIAAATIEIGEKMEARTKETQQFAAGPDSRNRKAAKRLIAKAATDMEQFVHRIEAELPLFSQHLNAGINALIQASQMSLDFTIKGEDLEQVKENLAGVRALCETLTGVDEQITAFQRVVASLPRMTTQLNRAKRLVVDVLQRLIDEIRGGHTMTREAEASFMSILEQKTNI